MTERIYYRWDRTPKARELLSDLRGDLLAYAIFGILVDYASARQRNTAVVSRRGLADALSGGNPRNRPSLKAVRIRLDKMERLGLIRRPSPSQRKRDGWTKGEYEVELLYLPMEREVSRTESNNADRGRGQGRKGRGAKVGTSRVTSRGQQDLERDRRLSTGPPLKRRPVESGSTDPELDAQRLRDAHAEWKRNKASRGTRGEGRSDPSKSPADKRSDSNAHCFTGSAEKVTPDPLPPPAPCDNAATDDPPQVAAKNGTLQGEGGAS